MSMRLFRARACCLITAILLAAGTTSAAVGELLHAGVSHDAACVSIGDPTHDVSNHRVSAPADGFSPDDHCVGCHLARALRMGAQPFSTAGHGEEAASPHPIAAIGSARAASLDNLPPRSPPRLS